MAIQWAPYHAGPSGNYATDSGTFLWSFGTAAIGIKEHRSLHCDAVRGWSVKAYAKQKERPEILWIEEYIERREAAGKFASSMRQQCRWTPSLG